MSVKPVYVMCVLNIYADEPHFAEETDEDLAKRNRRFHYAGFTADEAEIIVRARFDKSCAHNWYEPVLLGEFPTKIDGDGREVVDAVLVCPHCGVNF